MHNVDIRNVSVGQIAYFVKVAEYENITKAAKYFNLSQPTLSKKLNSLESQLDLQLFIREPKRIRLTPAGEYLYNQWKNQMNNLEQQVQYAHVLQQGRTKSIVVACMDSFNMNSFLLPIAEQFRKKFPDTSIRIELDSAQDIRQMLLNDEADVIFSIFYDFDQKKLDNIDWVMLGKTTHCACMKRTNPLASRESITMKDLRRSDFVCISPQYLPEYINTLTNLCKPAGYAPNIVNYVASANSLTLNLLTDRDVFICDKYYADRNQDAHVMIPIEDTESGFVMAWNMDNQKSYVQEFLTMAMEDYM